MGVVIVGSFQALDVEKEKRRTICCFRKERRGRERLWISERLNSPPPSSSLPLLSLSLLHGLLIWDLFKSRTAPQEDFFLAGGKGTRLPLSRIQTHPHTLTRSPKCLIPLSTRTWKGSYQTLKVSFAPSRALPLTFVLLVTPGERGALQPCHEDTVDGFHMCD